MLENYEVIEIKQVSDFIKNIEDIKDENSFLENDKQTWVYRGEPKLFDTSLKPSLFRIETKKDILKYEKDLLDTIYDERLVENSSSNNISRAIDSQHYIATSRLLDITYNPLKALYFAIMENEYKDDDAYVYMFYFENNYSVSSSFIEKYYNDTLNGIKFPLLNYSHILLRNSKNNDRIKAQDGGFIFFPGNEFYEIPSEIYIKICVKSDYKQILKTQLETLFGYNNNTIYPEKDKLQEKIQGMVSVNVK